MTTPVKIISLQMENVKRVQLVEITPTASGLTVIGGNNAQGKTSILDGVIYALGGERYRPTNLQRLGGMADPRIELTLSNGIKVERKGKNSALTVTDPDGRKGGQKLLDSFVEQLALDLPKFLQMDGKAKALVLLNILGIRDQLEKLEKEERKLYDERLASGRIADQKLKYWREMPEHHDVPEMVLSASELLAKVNAIHNRNNARQAAKGELAKLAAEHDRLKGEQARIEREIDELMETLRENRKRQADMETKILHSGDMVFRIGDMESTGDLTAQLDELEATNARVRQNLDKGKAKDDSEQAAAHVAGLTEQIEAVRKDRLALLDGADMPLAGLSVSDGELIYNNCAWDCMSSSEQVKAGIAIVRKLKPSCGFVLLDKLECFDALQLAELGRWLEQEQLQALATRVSTGGECSIIIEDGMVAGAAVAEAQNTEAKEEPSWE